MDTKIGQLLQVPVATGQPPVKPEMFLGRREAPLGKRVGVTQFGANHVTLEPGSFSSLRHWHEGEDEFVFVLSGEVVLIDENGEHVLAAGSFAGFPASVPNGHHLTNRSASNATLLVVGTRKPGRETIHYPDDGFGPVSVVRDERGERVTG